MNISKDIYLIFRYKYLYRYICIFRYIYIYIYYLHIDNIDELLHAV